VQSSLRQPFLQTPLHIAVVTETYPPEINGVARTVGLMVDGLRERGHHIELIRPRQTGDRDRVCPTALNGFEERLTVGIPIPKYPQLQLGLTRVRRLTRAWSERRPNIVHVVTEGPLGWSALFAARQLSIPVVSDFHTNFHDYSRHYGFGWISGLVTHYLRALHNRTQRTYVPTQEMRDRLATLGFERLEIVGRGIDTTLFNPSRRSEELRHSWGWPRGALVALYVGRLASEKNLRLFVEAVQAIRHEGRELRVVIVGDGPMGAHLRAAHPDFHFAGMRTGEDLASHYASADFFFFPSLSETFGNVTLEALASGLAVVAFNYAAARQHIVHGHSGLLADPNDDGGFREHAIQLVRDPDEARMLGKHARTAMELLSWSKTIDELENSLIKLAYAHSAGRTASLTNAPDQPGSPA
jgi:glycosyltransferase involved in cell wall biosynthesis